MRILEYEYDSESDASLALIAEHQKNARKWKDVFNPSRFWTLSSLVATLLLTRRNCGSTGNHICFLLKAPISASDKEVMDQVWQTDEVANFESIVERCNRGHLDVLFLSSEISCVEHFVQGGLFKFAEQHFEFTGNDQYTNPFFIDQLTPLLWQRISTTLAESEYQSVLSFTHDALGLFYIDFGNERAQTLAQLGIS